jgi:tripartite-type tricarboxylate transporter receptor subunit TctC
MAGVAGAQNFPVKPIRFVVGASPDLLPRLLGQKLAERWGQQVVVDQRMGASGLIAGELVAKSPPDGYTWLMSTATFLIVSDLYPKVPYDIERDFAAVTLMATLPWIVAVHPSVPAKSLQELVQLARARPGQLNYASAGNGTSTHLVTEMFKSAAKIDMVHVPYKAVVPAVVDTIAGQTQVMFVIAQAGVPHVASGKLRALAITSPKRSAAVPDVPTVSESGFPEIGVVGWNGLHVPAKTPRALVNRIHGDMAAVLAAPDTKERMLAAGFELATTSVAEFEAFVKQDLQRYRKAIKDARVRID